MSRLLPNRPVTAVALVPLLLVLGCGGGGDGDEASDSNGTTAVIAEQEASVQECLAERGIEMPDRGAPGERPSGTVPSAGAPSGRPGGPGGGQFELPEGVTQEDMREAMEECGVGRPEDIPGLSEIQAYSSCLDDNGVSVDEDDEGPPQIDREDPAFAAADEKCAALRPAAPSTSATAAP